MWPAKTILYFGMFWVACFMSVFNPIWGVVNYMMAYQSHPTATWWGAPLLESGMRLSLYAAIFTVIGMFFSRKRVPSAKPFLTPWELGVIALVMIGFLNILLGVSYDHRTQAALEKLWKMMVFVLILARLGSSRANLKLILWSLAMGSLYVGYDAYTAGPKDFLEGRLNRIGGPDFSTSSGTAAYFSAMLPIIGTVFLISKSFKARCLATAAGMFTMNGIILCRTRSAFIGLVAGTFAAIIMAPQAKRYRIHALLIAGGLLTVTLADDHFWTRMATMTNPKVLSEDKAATSRTDIWKVSLSILADYPQGIGVGNFARIIGQYDSRYKKRATHNTVIVGFVELGIHGGLIFMAMIGTSFWYLYRVSRIADRTDAPIETRFMAYGILISCVTYIVTGLGTERFYCESFWWILVLPVCLHRTVVHEIATQRLPVLLEESADENEESMLNQEWEIDAAQLPDGNPHRPFA